MDESMGISLLCQLRRPRSKDIPVAVSTPCAQILASNTVLHKKEQASTEKWLILGLGARNVQDEPVVRKPFKKQTHPTLMGAG